MCKINFIMLFSFSLMNFLCFLYFLFFDYSYFIEWEIISIFSVKIIFIMLFDWMSFLFMSFVSLISSVVVYYSMEYMEHDLNINRFIMLVLMFVFSMMLLIISPNIISILLGWDGLGLVSYCLVIYFSSVKSYNAGMLTVLSNRVGDVALLMGIAWALNFGSFNVMSFFEVMHSNIEMFIIGWLLVIAAMTKSAQIPFSSWLPAAMAAPTPVSALVHSSTLVTAGVYLLIRFNVLVYDNILMKFLLLISGLTMFMAGLGANFEFDLKKIIALSTLSQLGLMMSILSLGFIKLAFFHLLTHALFKALLFMCAGKIIHNFQDMQDMRVMGGLGIYMPMTSACFNTSNLALCGMPFLAGFYSKDLILEMVLMNYMNMFSFLLFFLSTGLTVCYTFRLFYYVMISDLNCSALNMLSDEGWVMMRGMLVLVFMSIISGSMLMWLIFPTPYVIILPWFYKLLTIFVCIIGALLGYFLSVVGIYNLNKFYKNYFYFLFMGSMWFMPQIFTYGVVKYPLALGKNLVKNFDYGWLEFMGSQKIFDKLVNYSQYNIFLQNNSLKIYFLIFILWVLVLMLMLFI
uniref:NADH-ubiquinone oxidoreductase chain 5 n=1 Tax=Fergusonina taylori TaxID=991131 RepID=H6TDN2_9MUSC|nr:NADH dehydrogenase subunit 5 [Fergusonina taylori]ADY85998.1 NADH dehydrogenase subunit 5 [Fergusonina taylori]